MPKFNFENSRYSKLWNSVEGSTILTMLLNSPDMIRTNYNFWESQFDVDSQTTPTNSQGVASFVSKMRKLTPAGMLNMRAPLGDSIPRDKEGIAFYTGIIPDFIADGYVEQAMEREYKEQMFIDAFGNDATIISAFADEVQSMVDDANASLSNMSGQILSKGNIVYKYGKGATGALYKADIPAENFIKAGEKTWEDPSCKLLDQMVLIERTMKESWGLENLPMKWQIPYKMFHDVFLKNAQVIDLVKQYRTINDLVVTENMQVTEAMFRTAITQIEGLSPIEIIVEKQFDNKVAVNGWDEKIAVLRPQGRAGLIRHTSILDQKMYEKYGAKAITRVFAKAGRGGLFTIMNTTLDNGNLREWHTDLMMAAIPSLDEFLYHVIVDTKTANE